MTTIEQLNDRGQGYLPGLMGIEFLSLELGRPELLAPNGYLNAAVVIALADTARSASNFPAPSREDTWPAPDIFVVYAAKVL